MDAKTERILLSDGRLGRQTRYQSESGEYILAEIVVTREADGTPCQHVYAPIRYLDARVYSFADLGQVTWEIVSLTRGAASIRP